MNFHLRRLIPAALSILAIAGALETPAAKKSHDSAVARNLNVFNALVKEL